MLPFLVGFVTLTAPAIRVGGDSVSPFRRAERRRGVSAYTGSAEHGMFAPLDSPVYGFKAGEKATYKVEVAFEGWLPLFGGKESKAVIAMTVAVEGMDAADKERKAVSELTAFEATLNDAKLPFTVANVNAFFPRTTARFSARGELLETDAPDRRLPVRLPGLDAKRFPDFTYLPLVLPVGEGEYAFTKPFADGPVEYHVTPTTTSADTLQLAIRIAQKSVAYEDAKGDETTQDKAETTITTELSGNGTALFDARRGLFQSLDLMATSDGTAVAKDGKTALRHLLTHLKIVLK